MSGCLGGRSQCGIEPAIRSGACAVAGLTYRLAEGRVTVIATSGAVGEVAPQWTVDGARS